MTAAAAGGGPAYAFRRVVPDDLPMLSGWLREPHVSSWWGEPDEELALIAGDVDAPGMRLEIVSVDGRPFAYVQAWDVAHYEDRLGQPDGTRGIDSFIGVPELAGRGHGSRFVRLFAERLVAEGAPRVIVDPDPANGRAIGCYRKAGFVPLGAVDLADGPAFLMAWDAANGKTTR